jgi:hypothetical protein
VHTPNLHPAKKRAPSLMLYIKLEGESPRYLKYPGVNYYVYMNRNQGFKAKFLSHTYKQIPSAAPE